MTKLCECGCGNLAPIAEHNYARRGWVKGEPTRFIKGHNSRGLKGDRNGNWNGGRSIQQGYIYILAPDHPRANEKGYVPEHIVVLGKSLGRPILPTEDCHHIDENPVNNAIGNLMVFRTHGMHVAFHARQRAFEASGHWNWRQCSYCHQYDDPDNMSTSKGRSAFHKSCKLEYSRARKVQFKG